uniref:acyltransferase Pun1-like n=1 Tax=Erigeron canadensis TaxID=72917 RepID=UPI001CB96F66|nr:acyltransferase Pun1-like [Erigeron canadensis]
MTSIILRELIKPASPAPFHLCDYNLSPLDQLAPELNVPCTPIARLVGVQLNPFACGGIAPSSLIGHVACYGSLDHKKVSRFNPHFIHTPLTNSVRPEYEVIDQKCVNPVTRKFMFPNSKLSDLRNKVMPSVAAGSAPPIKNPTRVELLTSLLYKTAMAAATTRSGSFKPSHLYFPMDIRNKYVQKFPQTSMGNFVFQRIQQAAENRKEILLSKLGDTESAKTSCWCLSICGFPSYHIDFGWGKLMDTTSSLKEANMSGFLLKDAPDGAGTEALIILEKETMAIFENNKEMLSFCQT